MQLPCTETFYSKSESIHFNLLKAAVSDAWQVIRSHTQLTEGVKGGKVFNINLYDDKRTNFLVKWGGWGILRAVYLNWHHIDWNRKFAPILNKHTHPGPHDIDWQQTQVLIWCKHHRRVNSSRVSRGHICSVFVGAAFRTYTSSPPGLSRPFRLH